MGEKNKVVSQLIHFAVGALCGFGIAEFDGRSWIVPTCGCGGLLVYALKNRKP